MKSELKLLSCFCGGKVKWCGEGDKENDEHECHQITCTVCGLQFDLNSNDLYIADTVEEAKEIMSKAFNTRTLPPEVQAVLDAAIECYDNKSDKLVKWNKVFNAVKALKDKE